MGMTMGKSESMMARSWWFFLAAGMIVLALHLVACGSGGPGGRQGVEAEERPNLILLTVDTWRGDHFLAQLGGVALTPNLEQLAAESMVFENAASVACATSAGVAGILTGLIPKRSGVVVNDHRLPATIPTLATLLQDLGYRTGAFVANPVVEPGHGFERGFETYELIRKERPRRKARAEKVNEQGLAWLDSLQGKEPFFLWLHYMEPHGPYEPPVEILDLFTPETFEGSRDIALLDQGDNSGRAGIPFYQQYRQKNPAQEASHYSRRYAAEVRAMDEQAGKLIDALRQRSVFEESIFILSADHGEALDGEQGFFFSHGNGLTQDQISVPLLLHCPGCEPGQRLQQPVSTADILPTVVSLLHLDGPEMDGTSLLNPAPREVVSQFSRAFSLRLGNWKLRSSRAGVFLHDLGADPGEIENLHSAEAERFQQLRRRLGEVRQRPPLAAPEARGEVSAERRKILESLGYL
jgi:arylsulfatase